MDILRRLHIDRRYLIARRFMPADLLRQHLSAWFPRLIMIGAAIGWAARFPDTVAFPGRTWSAAGRTQ